MFSFMLYVNDDIWIWKLFRETAESTVNNEYNCIVYLGARFLSD